MRMNWAWFNNIRLLHMACVPVVVFYLIWLVNTSESVRGEEGALLDLICWPDGNAIPVIIACGSIVAIFVQLYGLYQLFKAGLCKSEANVSRGFLYYIISLILLIALYLVVIFYVGLQSSIVRAKIKDGISKAMQQYSRHLPSKVAIDKLQTRFHCCGRISYEEWFYIPWDSLKQHDDAPLQSGKFIADNVPFSCCSMDVMWPCVHYGVHQTGAIYKYHPEKQMTISTFGCEEKLVKEMSKISWSFIRVMTLITIAMALQCSATRYLQTAYMGGLHLGNQISCDAYLLRATRSGALELEPPKRSKWYSRRDRQSKSRQIVDWINLRIQPGVESTPHELERYSDDSQDSADELLKRFN